jgi:ubiquinone/menaquinone biosynthesis C-methylase UbiE
MRELPHAADPRTVRGRNRGDGEDLVWKTVAVCEPEYSDDYTDPRLAVFYNQLNPWGPSDDFYLQLITAAESVLDVGCGTGNLLRRARESGHTGRLVGLDPAAAMLSHASDRSDVDWILGDLGTVSFDHEFDLVVMTGHVFQLFLTDDDIAAALGAVRVALAEGGRYAFETLNPRLRPWEQWTGSTEVIAADGVVVTAANTNPRLIDGQAGGRGTATGHTTTGHTTAGQAFADKLTAAHNARAQIVEVAGRFSSPSWERDVLCPSRLRFTDVDALDLLLSQAGFRSVARFGWWDRCRYDDEQPEVITIAAGR